MIIFYFLLLIPYVTSLSFNLSKIGTDHQNVIKVHASAYISPDGLQVTSDSINSDLWQRAGKATYVQLLDIWDKSSHKLTNFSTHFTFVVKSKSLYDYADGFTFFLAPEGSNTTAGGAMGLPIHPDTIKPTSPFVAVEFDTFPNKDWDPEDAIPNPHTHVGISINSLKSKVTAVWNTNISAGITTDCWINYDSESKNLSVVFTGSRNGINITTSNISLVVDLREIFPERVSFGFSASTGASFETHTIKSWDFTSSLEIENPEARPTGQPEPNITPRKKKKKKAPVLIIGLAICSCVLVGGLAFLGLFFWRRRQRRRNKEEDDDGDGDDFEHDMTMEGEFEMGSGPKKFSYSELSLATNDFSEDQMLGKGGFGGVYRGFVKESNSDIAVKKISKGSKQGLKEYASEVRIISRLRHRNLVQLIGWCHERRELLLVYEFMENGSLDFHLFKGKSMLAWPIRFKIAQGLASALLYLHQEWEQCVVHRDIKSSNVMLDSNFNAKLGDFGLARFVDHEKGSQTTVLAGTMGYMAPECVVTGRASKESDVYSLGVVMLEIACGRKPFELQVEERQVRMVEWVWDLYGTGKLLEAADPKLDLDFDQQEMARLMIVGLWCAHPDYNLRPSIRQAIQVLNFEAPLPDLPLKMPVPTYFTPPVSASASSVSLYSGAAFSTSSQNQSSTCSYNTNSSNLAPSSAGSSPSASLLYSKTS